MTLAHLSIRTLRNSITFTIHKRMKKNLVMIKKSHMMMMIRAKTLKMRMRTAWSQVMKAKKAAKRKVLRKESPQF